MKLPEFKIRCSLVNSAGHDVGGTLIMSDNTVLFTPSSLMKVLVFWNNWSELTISIKDIVGYKKLNLGYIRVYLYNGGTYDFNVFNKDTLIAEINRRRVLNSYAPLKSF